MIPALLLLLAQAADPISAAIATMTPEQKAAQLQSTAPPIPPSACPPMTGGTKASTASPATARRPSSRRRSALPPPGTPICWGRSAPSSRPRRAPSSMRSPSPRTAASTRASPSGRPTSTSPRSALGPRAGDVRRGPVSHRHIGVAFVQGCKGPTPPTRASSPRRSTSPSTAAPKPVATVSTSIRPHAISKRPISPPSAARSPKAGRCR